MSVDNVPVYVLTNRKHHWLLPGFCYLFEKYWPDSPRVAVASYGEEPAGLPARFGYRRIEKENRPAQEWSTGLLTLLDAIRADWFILMLEDYWLRKPVDANIISNVLKFASEQDKSTTLRVDLTADRSSRKGAKTVTRIDGVEFVETPPDSPYQMSFQAAVWNKALLRSVLRLNETPWQAEIAGTQRLRNRPDKRVFGTRSRPLNYVPVFRSLQSRLSLDGLLQEDREIIQEKGWDTW